MQRLLVPFAVGERWVTIDAGCVQEILGSEAWVAVPGAKRELPGVMAWRGRAVAVCDVGALFGLTPLGQERRARTLVLQLGGHMMAVPVDRVREVHAIEDNAITRALGTQHPLAPLEARFEDRVMPLLDLGAFVLRETDSA